MAESWRIVLLGKTGSGKSSLGNTIFGEDVFQVCHSPNSGTKSCMDATRQVNGKSVKLIDTPGIFDTDLTSHDYSPELLKCFKECAPGPHAFLLVFRVLKFTRQEQDVVDTILKYFTEESFKYTTVVFTQGNDLPEGMQIENWVFENPALKNLVEKCGHRCHVFDNSHWNKNPTKDPYRNNKFQIESLLNTIEKTVMDNGRRYYSNELLTCVGNNHQHLTNLASVSTGMLLGALLGVPVMIVAGLQATNVPVPITLLVMAGITGGGTVGGLIGHKAAQGAKTPQMAAEATVNAIWEFVEIFISRIRGKKRKYESETEMV